MHSGPAAWFTPSPCHRLSQTHTVGLLHVCPGLLAPHSLIAMSTCRLAHGNTHIHMYMYTPQTCKLPHTCMHTCTQVWAPTHVHTCMYTKACDIHVVHAHVYTYHRRVHTPHNACARYHEWCKFLHTDVIHACTCKHTCTSSYRLALTRVYAHQKDVWASTPVHMHTHTCTCTFTTNTCRLLHTWAHMHMYTP